jgi:hypothetical protein
MRADFGVMRELASHTRIAPSRREKELLEFTTTIAQNPHVKKVCKFLFFFSFSFFLFFFFFYIVNTHKKIPSRLNRFKLK